MSEDKNKTPLYYPRKMRTGWCVAHEVTAAGVTIERYGIHCQTYAEAYRRAEVIHLLSLPYRHGFGLLAAKITNLFHLRTYPSKKIALYDCLYSIS